MLIISCDVRELIGAASVWSKAAAEMPEAVAATLNRVGDLAGTQVNRALAKQMGLPYGKVKNGLSRIGAAPDRLQFAIVGTGRRLSLKGFGATQRRAGVSARPWGKRRIFRGTFIIEKLSGQVFKRVGGERRTYIGIDKATGRPRKRTSEFPLEKLWGPGIPTEMVRGLVPYVFQATARERFPDVLQHNVERLLKRSPRLLAKTSAGRLALR